jgi:hypothetical protein
MGSNVHIQYLHYLVAKLCPDAIQSITALNCHPGLNTLSITLYNSFYFGVCILVDGTGQY